MKIYLDTCSIQRPWDDKSQPRIALEAEAILAILSLNELGQVEIVSSEVLLVETNCNPLVQRRMFASEILTRSQTTIKIDDYIKQHARKLEQLGFKPIDALHLASAENAKVDCFCTCDDRLYKKAKLQSDFTTTILTPLELAQLLLK